MTHPQDRDLLTPDLDALPEDGGPDFNRLIFSSSPYLLQHARNPVDWRPWGEEAFVEARKRDLPVFVSIGYSTCHWCHVMERESFENPDIASYLNAHFISVKVDREERPDIDNIHMAVCQALTGQGGWPLTVFLKPDATPFFAGTYFPPEDHHGRPGFLRLLTLLHEAWTGQRERIDKAGEEILQSLHTMQAPRPGEPDPRWLQRAESDFLNSFDSVHGGFGRAPKFPMGHTLSFLLHRFRRTGNPNLAEMAVRTLRAIRRGGIFDQVGLGLCRYSTDERWLVPHFEKMLYDNALLLLAACDAYQATGDGDLAEMIRQIAEYTTNSMTSPEELWYSAEDADSEGREGKFYVFSWKEWIEVLGPERGPVLAEYFGVRSEGNFEDGNSILHVAMDLDQWANRHGLTREAAIEWIDEARSALHAYRESRVRPALDDKCLASWNGLMLAALSRAARVLNDEAIGKAAIQGAEALRSTLIREDGSVRHSIRNGKVSEVGFLDDSSFLAWGFLELYQWRFQSRDLETALLLHSRMVEDFGDEALRTLFITKKDGDPLLVRPRESYDGALPSGASVAVVNAVRLAHLTGEEHWSRQAWEWITSFGQAIEAAPSSHAMMLAGLDLSLKGMTEIIITAPDREASEPFLDALRDRYLPSAVVHVLLAKDQDDLVSLVPHLQEYPVSKEGPTVYLCHNKVCGPPIRSVEELRWACNDLVS